MMTDQYLTNRTYTQSGYCTRWGSQKNARRVFGLTKQERKSIRSGNRLYLADCPRHEGETDRVIVPINGCFYTRMP